MWRVILAGVVLAGLVVVLPAAGAPAPSSVTVVNTSASPVPVQVTGTPAVKIDPTGNTMKIDPSQNTVQVSGPVRVQQETEQPFAVSVVQNPVGASSSGGATCQVPDFTPKLPLDQPFRVESVSVDWLFASPTENPHAGVRFSYKLPDGTSLTFQVPVQMNDKASNGFGFASGTAQVGITLTRRSDFSAVPPGEFYGASACLNRGDAGTSAAATVTLIGHLLPDSPAPALRSTAVESGRTAAATCMTLQADGRSKEIDC
jgi:hypothetical protein